MESGADVLSLEIDDGVDHYVVPWSWKCWWEAIGSVGRKVYLPT